MKFLYIELNGYKRFPLSNISHLSMHFTETLQMILGTNGSGKSSLLSEITPLPANHADYSKTGSKIVKIEHNGYTYTLKSTFFPTQKHSFERGTEELNEGGTITVQRELVKHQFGITPDINELLLGKEPFDSMSPGRRKEWFIRLCDTNYDYAIKVYNKLREKHRDASGAIKLAKKRLIHESEKLIQSDEEEQLHVEAKNLHECLNHLLEYRKPVEKDLDNLQVHQGQLDEQLIKLARNLQNLMDGRNPADTDFEELEERISRADGASIRSKALIEKYTTDFLKNQKSIDALQKAEQQTIGTLEESIQELSGQAQQLQSTALVPGQVFRSKAAMDAFQTVKLQLSDVFTTIPQNKEKIYSQKTVVEKREKQAELLSKKLTLIEVVQEKSAKIKHMDIHKDKPDLQCPSCHHKFSLNYNEDSYFKITADVIKLNEEIQQLNTEMKAIDEYLTSFAEYAQLYKQYAACVSSWPILASYWAYLQEKQVITDNPQSGVMEMAFIEKDLLSQIDREAIEEKIAEKQKLLVSLKDVGGADLNTLLAQNEELNTLIEEETSSLQMSMQTYTSAVSAKSRYIQIESISKKVTEIIQKKRGVNKDEIETVRRMELNNAIRQVQSALASREHILNNLSVQKGIVANVTQQIFDLEKEEEALGILVKQLSPSEGLIAEGLLGFIRNYISQMNAFIKKVWAYPLVIQSCEVLEDGVVDLDYKFPMMVATNDKPVPDISKGSEGMKEIINLAHRLIAMKYLHLQDFPLMLDEFAARFDEAHRAQATFVIKSLIEQQAFSQFFMVSHYEAAYGALSNAQICMINGQNVTMPKLKVPVNSHVTMH